ncbi:hypothetical protein, partial [Vibrio astriarenae]|uniref:hypothetical protein n=1 Tax=Vibrio astriarenae TaxID=1481923 RepID=UPI003735E6BA
AELVDAPDLGSGAARCESSSLSFRTIIQRLNEKSLGLFSFLSFVCLTNPYHHARSKPLLPIRLWVNR